MNITTTKIWTNMKMKIKNIILTIWDAIKIICLIPITVCLLGFLLIMGPEKYKHEKNYRHEIYNEN